MSVATPPLNHGDGRGEFLSLVGEGGKKLLPPLQSDATTGKAGRYRDPIWWISE